MRILILLVLLHRAALFCPALDKGALRAREARLHLLLEGLRVGRRILRPQVKIKVAVLLRRVGHAVEALLLIDERHAEDVMHLCVLLLVARLEDGEAELERVLRHGRVAVNVEEFDLELGRLAGGRVGEARPGELRQLYFGVRRDQLDLRGRAGHVCIINLDRDVEGAAPLRIPLEIVRSIAIILNLRLHLLLSAKAVARHPRAAGHARVAHHVRRRDPHAASRLGVHADSAYNALLGEYRRLRVRVPRRHDQPEGRARQLNAGRVQPHVE